MIKLKTSKGINLMSFSLNWPRLLPSIILGITLSGESPAAELPVNLGSAANFGVLAASTVTSSGGTVITGDLGLWPGTSVSGFPPGNVVGTKHVTDPAAKAAEADLTIAFNDAAGRTTAPVPVAGNIGGLTLGPGLYKSTSDLSITSGDLVLDGQGDPNAVFIFQIATTLITTTGRQVILIGGAQAANVFWQVGSSATIGTSSGFKGTILADQSISLQTGASLQGRALARVAGVTLDNNAITVPVLLNGGGQTNVVSTNLFVTSVSPIILNPQTGLFEQTVHVSNNSADTVEGARLLISGLPPDVQVYNASGKDGSTPFVQYSLPLPPDSSLDLLIEYYRVGRQPIPQPGFVVLGGTVVPVTSTGPVIQVDRSVQLQSGRFLIEFSAIPGRRYVIQYSSDMETWKSANPIITAPSNKVQWYDDGPPKTESAPTSGSRFYRVMVLP
ncbi:MAG TPA: ice-binding family protein [Candidatus Saccharimonadales bacterium]|nr:ice-binding family protein [Candidatus Saccharimonadales bacterium]